MEVRGSGPPHLPLRRFAEHFAHETRGVVYAAAMPRHIPVSRTHSISRTAPDFQRPALTRRVVTRSEISVPHRGPATVLPPSSAWLSSQPDPYVDYGRWLTPEGGILLVHKDFDLRWRHTVWRLFAWTLATGGEAWQLLHHPQLRTGWIIIACIIGIAIINWLIVRKPVEVYRRVEIRPDCMIIEGTDVFWVQFMEAGWPSFRTGMWGSQILCGIYGTRFVEYLTIRSFDKFDRGIDVFRAHLQDAMQQLWNRSGIPI